MGRRARNPFVISLTVQVIATRIVMQDIERRRLPHFALSFTFLVKIVKDATEEIAAALKQARPHEK